MRALPSGIDVTRPKARPVVVIISALSCSLRSQSLRSHTRITCESNSRSSYGMKPLKWMRATGACATGRHQLSAKPENRSAM